MLCQACIWLHTIVFLHLQFSLSKVVFISTGLRLLNVCAFLMHNILKNISTDIFLSACIPSSSIMFYNFICGMGYSLKTQKSYTCCSIYTCGRWLQNVSKTHYCEYENVSQPHCMSRGKCRKWQQMNHCLLFCIIHILGTKSHYELIEVAMSMKAPAKSAVLLHNQTLTEEQKYKW